MTAARQAIGEATWEEAAALLERGLAALDMSPSPDVERRCELLLLLAETWTRFFDPDRMMDAAARALDAARALGRPQPLGRAVYWRLRFLPLELTASDQTALVHEGLNALGDSEPGLRAKILAVGAQGADPAVWIPTAREVSPGGATITTPWEWRCGVSQGRSGARRTQRSTWRLARSW